MRRSYWLLLLFGIWCLVSSIWYLVSIKGIQTDPRFFSPQANTLAIFEILIILLVSCIIGLGIGWTAREQKIGHLTRKAAQLETTKSTLLKGRTEIKSQLTLARHQISGLHHASVQQAEQARREKESMEIEIARLKTEMPNVVAASAELEKLREEAASLQNRLIELDHQHHDAEVKMERLRLELDESRMRESALHPRGTVHPFIKSVPVTDKDDLTRIKGIGPFIEKRLNMLDIYTYRQISEMTPEMTEHIARAIEFFPKRITRDNWVGQAARLIQ